MDCVNISFQKDIIIQESYLIGEIIMWPKTIDYPNGFVACDGSSYSTVTYNKLYGVIGYKFGTNGSNFKVPNLNVSDTDTPILIKGDVNMTNNSVNKELNTGINVNIDGGVNTISNNILPSHKHGVSYNINTAIASPNIQVKSGAGGVDHKRAHRTENNAQSTEDGGQSSVNHIVNHFHNINYDAGDSTTKQMGNYTIVINHNVSNNQTNGLKNVTPSVTKIHYIIFTGVY